MKSRLYPPTLVVAISLLSIWIPLCTDAARALSAAPISRARGDKGANARLLCECCDNPWPLAVLSAHGGHQPTGAPGGCFTAAGSQRLRFGLLANQAN